MPRVFIGLGSNLGDRWRYLGDAVTGLSALDRALVVSPIYETAPVGGPPDQSFYLNAVVALVSDWAPRELLVFGQRLENEAGRVRTVRNGPRTLDVDLLIVEGVTVDDEDLVVPHPRIGERSFVLRPLSDLAPELLTPEWQERLEAPGASSEDAVRHVGELVRSPA